MEETEKSEQLNKPQDSEKSEEKSELQQLKEKLEKLEEENKRIREEKIEQKTDPNYIRRVQDDRRKRREALILNQRLPQGKRLSKDDMENMSVSDIVGYVEDRLSQTYNAIQRDKINPMYEQVSEDTLQSGLRELSDIDPDWINYQEEMLPIARANPSIAPIDCYMAALAAKKDWNRLDKVRDKLNPKKKETKKVEEKKEEIREEESPRQSSGERPSTSVLKVRKPQERMSPKAAAEKAYEDVIRGNI